MNRVIDSGLTLPSILQARELWQYPADERRTLDP
jgi:hypothetical protein